MPIPLFVTAAPSFAGAPIRLLAPYAPRAATHPTLPLPPAEPPPDTDAIGEVLRGRTVRYVRALIDAIGGRRALPQPRHPGEEVPFLRLAALRTEVGGQRPTLRSVRLQSPAGGVVEVAAVVQLGTRVGALALRLLEAPDGFACVALQASLRLSCRPGAHGRP